MSNISPPPLTCGAEGSESLVRSPSGKVYVGVSVGTSAQVLSLLFDLLYLSSSPLLLYVIYLSLPLTCASERECGEHIDHLEQVEGGLEADELLWRPFR